MSGLPTASETEQATEDLQRRLEEAEETLRAIRDGEVDALVIGGGPRLEEVFTLEGGTESYRAFMEAMDFGAAALDAEGRLVYANSALCDLLDRSSADLHESGLFAALDPSSVATLREIVATADDGKRTAEIKVTGGGAERNLLVSAAGLRLGLSRGVAVTFADLTARVRAAAAEESERMARAIITSANEAVVVCDEQGDVTHANAAALAICAESPIGRPFRDAIPLVVSTMPGLMQGDDLIAMAVSGSAVQGVEASAPEAPRAKDLLVSAAPLVVAGQRTRGCVVTLVDVTEHKAAERQQQLLMNELDHRVRNTLTLVMSICARTASKEDTVEGFQKAFAGRIQALAATHKLLAEKGWADLTIREIVLAELAPYVGAASARVDMKGLDAPVTARAATALGLIFHELATNAVKYGALSRNEGSVQVSASETRDALLIEWRETGGPEVSPPTRSGFGQTVISRSLAFAPEGGAEMAFHPSGVVCSLRVPACDVRAGQKGRDAAHP